ncbi:MAG TPA: pirin family protein [Methylophilaceae bacterium]|nr:pirin family protein [Methylophilaceae bacterium]
MIKLRKSQERGHAHHGWLDSHHTFSFGHYHDPRFMGYSVLRVINEDVIAPGRGFGMHPHNDMEIITYMLDGELRHQDSLGNGAVIRRGDVQRMTAGSGIVHSEYNASSEHPAHLLQIWIVPDEDNLHPSYEDKRFDDDRKHGRWCLIASNDGRGDSLRVHQDIALYAAVLDQGQSLSYDMSPERTLYLQVARGDVCLTGLGQAEQRLTAGDAAMVGLEQVIRVEALKSAEVLVFDLPVNLPPAEQSNTH